MGGSLQFITVLHILFATLWLGYSLGQSRVLKRFADASDEHWNRVLSDVARRTRLGMLMGVLTLGTGVGLIALMGGVQNVSPAIHTALVVSLLMVGLTFFGQDGSVRKLIQAEDALARVAGAKQYGMFTGMLHLGWLVNLGLMVFRNYWTVS